MVFITGTDTDIGKTIVSAWLCLHLNYSYFKPIQSGKETDTNFIKRISKIDTYNEIYSFNEPVSPHIASKIEDINIELPSIILPKSDNLIIEGAGGVLTPINDKLYMLDLIKYLKIPTIIVCSYRVGTINHTLMTIEALKNRDIDIYGVIMSNGIDKDACNSIERYGEVKILDHLPRIKNVTANNLLKIPISKEIRRLFSG